MRRAKKEGRYMGLAPVGYKNKIDQGGHKYIAPKEPDATILNWAFEELSKGIDRKSTRLNSSHSQISYAVFCLKKKKKKKKNYHIYKKKKKQKNTAIQHHHIMKTKPNKQPKPQTTL